MSFTSTLEATIAAPSATLASVPLIDIEGLGIHFDGPHGRTTVVEGVDLRIRPGECVALVGESGSGKSVTARCLLDLVGPGARVSATRFLVDDADALRFDAATWRRLRGTFAGLVMQDALVSLDPLRTIGQEVGEVISHHHLLRGRDAIARRTRETLARVGISDPDERMAQYAHQLSGGLRQRALIAAAIAGEPRLIIADEPTTALDASIQKQVIEVLGRRVRDDGVGLLLISHDLSVVAEIADRVLVMRAGRVVEAGPAREVLSQPRHAYTRQLIAAVPSASSKGSRLASARFESAPADPDRNATRVVREPLPPRRHARGTGTSGERVLEVDGIGKRFRRGGGIGPARDGDFVALHDVSFSIAAGEVLGLVGESGSGKSTCAKIVLGLLEPDAGNVRLRGQAWSHRPEKARRSLRASLQYIPQDPLSSFDPRYTVREVIAENLGALSTAQATHRIHALLEQVGLDGGLGERRPRTLSGGQRQRVAIARALAAEPTLIVCDEPVSALDISIQAQVVDLIGELQSRLGTALLFISHDINLVHHIADRVLVLNEGRVVEQGSVDDVFLRPAHAYTRALLAAVPPPLTAAI
ncbi:dipeptide ABC transporter ATP-binding protein [Variovorax ginsengisoli]|uniref:Peptide/nickel transport system ATP-binding protein n=1 Tax=Variovorax ginsengisoli TaxID=363844 RepID=A0ABT9S5X8_9BURK|nr:ABC transporter ATP-binding protein [Variovorax ginsengisoli]MDP9898742.1 peptide/nickel transport system ATP-binding protein [Variovorax ginsengisoli]